jgi:hypothetical protein
MPLNARRLIRKMRGGAQAHLLEADDGHYYVVKFKNNPQHRRILINELIAGVFLRFLKISAPETAIVQVQEEFLAREPDVCLQLGTRRVPVAPGWHFGSRFPGDPAKVAVYDFLPDLLLQKVANKEEFLGALVFDKWMANADARQSVFFRARVREWEAQSLRHGFLAWMVDHGYVFDGPHWGFGDAPLQGLYHRHVVYEKVRSLDDFQPWLDRVQHFPEEVVDEAYKQVPPEWLEGDEEALEALLTRLLARRRRIADLIQDSARSRVHPFPNWG